MNFFFLTVGLIDGSILSIECGSMVIDHIRFYDQLSILPIKNKKSLTDGSITLMKMRLQVSIDSRFVNTSFGPNTCLEAVSNSVEYSWS
jgi:hypothetical protein